MKSKQKTTDNGKTWKYDRDCVRLVVNKEDMEKIIESANESEKIWNTCLKKSNGNYEKAKELYKKYYVCTDCDSIDQFKILIKKRIDEL